MIAMKVVTPYKMLTGAEEVGAHTIEIEELETGAKGVANTTENGVMVFYGNEDGSDDTEITVEDFNRRFRVTAAIRD